MKPTEAQTQPTGPGSSSADAAVQQPLLFVQALKGAPASVLLALTITGRFMFHHELILWTRCGHRQVTAALRTLESIGWIVARTLRGPWGLAPGRRLSLEFVPAEGSALGAHSSSGDSLNPIEEESLLPSAPRGHMRDALLKSGVREPTASELARLPHMTLEYLQAHIEGARLNGLQIGAAIQAMRLQAPPPARPLTTNRQARTEEQMRRFLEGA